MRQCDNCSEWVEDTIRIEWPLACGDEMDVYHLCVDCLDHLAYLRSIERDSSEILPEIGSEAAQRHYGF